jgi:aspartyl-tRNA(Asn)/glutamyl-tRNA(Gln) amidotransferase subunit A
VDQRYLKKTGRDRRVTLQTRRQFLAGAIAAGAAAGFAPETEAAAETITLPATIGEAGRRLRGGLLTAEALTRAYLACIGQLNPKLNAFITVMQEYALRTAAVRDLELRAGKDRGPLHGIPIVVKDAYDTAGIKTTAGSEFFKDRVPTEDATVVARLKAAGAIILGKTNMNEFGFGGSGQNKYYGDAHNPWDLARSPGGSSSGTAAALAAGLCLGGLGADGGGSIRIPSAWCGLVGIRPTYGRVSLNRAFLAGGRGCAGPLARMVVDLALLLTALAGYDPRDPNSLNVPPEHYTVSLGRGIRRLRFGIIDNYAFGDVDPDVVSAFRAAVDTMARLGAEITNVKIPPWSGSLDVVYRPFFTIGRYEVNQLLGDQYRAASNKDALGPTVRAAITAGEKITNAMYEQALADRSAQAAQVKEVFKTVDALLTPTMPMVAPPMTIRDGTPQADVLYNSRRLPFMVPFNFIGLPSMSIPCGFDRSGMPIGLQIVGNSLQEALLLRIAATYEAATEWHKRRAPLFCPHAAPGSYVRPGSGGAPKGG